MKGKIEGMNEHYALVKLPDGRTANIKIENLPGNSEKGHDIEIKGLTPQIME
jgi:hypothetical protein